MIKAILYSFVFSFIGLMAGVADQGTTARNPIIWADIPDMSMIRVGDTYYMSSTTMHMCPGLPIMESHDLVNWKLISYAYETLGDTDALCLANGKNAYGAGSWASSLRYHDHTFYVSTFSGTTGKTYIYKTRDPGQTPWTLVSSFAPALHDHSLFFDDDGRVYMVHGGGDIRLTELRSDLSGIKPGGTDQVIIPHAGRVASPHVGLPAEGSQLFKIKGKYYLFNITWPKDDMRTEIVHRADKITGPYEGRVFLHDRGIAQGGLVTTPAGNWYAYMFQDHGAVGRIPHLLPVKWVDGWPVPAADGKVPATLDLPASQENLSGIVASDEFDRKSGDTSLPLVWQWNHNPDNRLWSLTARPGYLRLTTGAVVGDLVQARNTLTQRTFGPESSAVTMIDTSHMKDGDCAGLTVFQKKYGFVGVKKTGNACAIVVVGVETDSPVQEASVPLGQHYVFLKARCDFRPGQDKACFSYSLDDKTWSDIGRPLQMIYTLPHFMGYRFGLFNFATKSPGGYVDFNFMRISGEPNS